MDCMKLKVTNENLKVRRALCPEQTCPNKLRLCPPVNKLRSSLYHPDFRTVNEYCCTKDCCYVPTETAIKVIKYKPPNQNLYNQPKREGGRIKILMDGSCYPHRDINQLHCNLQDPSPCAAQNQNASQLYICKDCGCGYQDKNDCHAPPCGPNTKGSACHPIYFEVDSSGMEDQSQNCVQDQCEPTAACSIPSGNHFQDCHCGLCKKRRNSHAQAACNVPQNRGVCKSSVESIICDNDECGSCYPQMQRTGDNTCNQKTGSGSSCCTQPNVFASLPDPACPERSNQVPCHHVFKLGNEIKQQPAAHCVIDMSQNNTIQNGNCDGASAAAGNMSCTQSQSLSQPSVSACWSNAFGNGIPVNQCVPKQRKKVCNCFYCAEIQCGKKSIHGPHCQCNLCQRMRCESKKRPYYYSHLRAKSQCKDKKTSCCSISRVPVCYPIKSVRCDAGSSFSAGCCETSQSQSQYSCKSNCLCHGMIPEEWEPQDCGNSIGDICGGQGQPVIKLPSSCQGRKANGCEPPYLVRSLNKIGKKNRCNGDGSSRGLRSRCRPSNSNCNDFNR